MAGLHVVMSGRVSGARAPAPERFPSPVSHRTIWSPMRATVGAVDAVVERVSMPESGRAAAGPAGAPVKRSPVMPAAAARANRERGRRAGLAVASFGVAVAVFMWGSFDWTLGGAAVDDSSAASWGIGLGSQRYQPGISGHSPATAYV
jgi:hypothetical protein